MDMLRAFLEQQPLLSMFLVIGQGYAVGGVNVRGFALGAGAVLFVGLGAGMFAPKAAPPTQLGSLGLLMFVYGVGTMYGNQVFSGLTSPFGLKANGLVLLSHLTGIGVCYVAYATFSVSPAAVAGLFCGALTSTRRSRRPSARSATTTRRSATAWRTPSASSRRSCACILP